MTALNEMLQIRFLGKTLKIRNRKEEEVENVDYSVLDGSEPAISFVGINTAMLYEAFANGETDKYATFEERLGTHRALDRVRQSSK